MVDVGPDERVWIDRGRDFVPSEREVESGLAEYRFEPMPEPEAEPKVRFTKRFGQLIRELDPRTVVAGYSSFPLILLSLDRLFAQWDDRVFQLLMPEIQDEFGFDIAFLITLTSVLGVAIQLFLPVGGYLADRVSRVRMLAIGNVVANGASIVASQAGSIRSLAVARAAGGMGGALSQPTSLPLLADWYPAESRARLVSFVQFAGGIGVMVAPLVAGRMGDAFGWRTTGLVLGCLATAVSLLFFLLKEPKRGFFDRMAMGASDEVALREQKPVSWSEGWRAAVAIRTVRRIWIATPFLIAGASIQQTLMGFYWAREFGLGGFQRGLIMSAGVAVGLISLPFAGPIADRLLADRPGRLFTILGGVLLLATLSTVLVALSPWLWFSLLVSVPLGLIAGLIFPAQLTILSMVIPARLRAFGVSTSAPFQLLGTGVILFTVQVIGDQSIRTALLSLTPISLLGAILIGTAGGGVEADIRAARAASMADEDARRARALGGNKMVICRDVDVDYGGTKVLFNVDFDVEEGELVALVGTNGAGKSTLLRAIAGIQQASNGAILLDGQDITHRPPHENARDGIVFMPGGRAIFPSLTVAENLRAAAWLYREDEEYVRTRTEEILDFFPVLRERLTQLAGSMSGGEQQQLALGQAFLMRPRLLMIDELSLGLSPAVVERLLDIVTRINEQGTTVILVEQSVNVALTVARRAVFMEKGEIRFDGPTAELLGRGDLLRSVFLGGATSGGGAFIAAGGGLMRPARSEEPELALEVEGVNLAYGGHQALRDAHVAVAGGEVVGIIGPNGAGKTSLFDVISGYTKPDSGRIVVAGVDCEGLGPDERARLGLSRSFQNARLFPALTVADNIAVALGHKAPTRSVVAAAAWLPIVRRGEARIKRRVDYLIDLLNLEAYADKFVSELSTGSRRMVDMACVMAADPKLLLLDEPSSGLAQSEVEVLGPVVRRLAKETGCGVLVIEHDMPLITALSDRLVAMELGAVLVEGDPHEVVAHPRVVAAYLGASEAAISRSGSSFTEALAKAGITRQAEDRPRTRSRSTKTPTERTDS